MSFGSIGGKFDINYGRSARFLNLHGQLYHRASSLHPSQNTHPSFAQLYVLDTEVAMTERMYHLNQVTPNNEPLALTQDEKLIINQEFY